MKKKLGQLKKLLTEIDIIKMRAMGALINQFNDENSAMAAVAALCLDERYHKMARISRQELPLIQWLAPRKFWRSCKELQAVANQLIEEHLAAKWKPLKESVQKLNRRQGLL